MRNGLLSRVDAEDPGVYHIYDACLQAGPRPALHFFTDDGPVPDPIAQDRATAVWGQCVGRRPEECRPDSMTDHYPETFDVPIEMVDALVRAHLLGAE